MIAFVKEMYGLPEEIRPFSLIAVGYSDGQKNDFVDRYQAEKFIMEDISEYKKRKEFQK